jgi:hypothetical protein
MPCRYRRLRGTPATPLEPEWPSGILSATLSERGASVSTGFPASDGGQGPHRSCRTSAQGTPHLAAALQIKKSDRGQVANGPGPLLFGLACAIWRT